MGPCARLKGALQGSHSLISGFWGEFVVGVRDLKRAPTTYKHKSRTRAGSGIYVARRASELLDCTVWVRLHSLVPTV